MHKLRLQTFFLGCLQFFLLIGTAQESLTISGDVADKTSGLGLPFATVSIVGTTLGSSTNSDGHFTMMVKNDRFQDSLEVSYIGYDSFKIRIADISSVLIINLVPSANLLKEVIIRPLTPEEYLKRIKKKIPDNYSTTPFENLAYYREEVKENGAFIMHSEGVFKTYHDSYQKESKRQHQLLLYKKSEDIQELEFMKERALKQRVKHLENNPDDTLKYTANGTDDLLMADMGGPDEILGIHVANTALGFLDSVNFKHYRYVYGPETTYAGKELITIEVESKGTVDHARLKGKVFVDKASDAIVAVEGHGDLVTPLVAKPIMLVMGIRINNPSFDMELRYQEIDGKWYPQQVQWSAHVSIKKKNLFKKNESATFDVEQVYVVNSLELDNPKEIAAADRYDSDRRMIDQERNDGSIQWNQVNVIR